MIRSHLIAPAFRQARQAEQALSGRTTLFAMPPGIG